jgi:predicted  nucleic acid-binding Zn-ribbon protein
MMEEETLRVIIRHLNELETELKTDISAVYDGQEELKNDIENSISAVKDDISALETRINVAKKD